ncbi:Actin-interacting protein 1-2 [Sarracenia purpurea var. burkii]
MENWKINNVDSFFEHMYGFAVEEEIVTSGFDNMIWRNSLLGDQCGDDDSVDISNQPKDLSLAILSPELTLVSIESGVVLINGTKVVSTINLGLAVTACEIAPDGSEAIVGGQDGKLHVFSINGDTLTEETILKKATWAANWAGLWYQTKQHSSNQSYTRTRTARENTTKYGIFTEDNQLR